MTPGSLTAASRRRLLSSVALLGAGLGEAAATVDRDAPLISAAMLFCDAERGMLALIEGPGSVADDAARDLLLAPLRDKQAPHLNRLCRERAWGLAGHRARALAFALWDGGELAERAGAQGLLADRLLAALIRDLADAPC